MLALFFYLFVSAVFAGALPRCFFGNPGYFYTDDSYTFDQYGAACTGAFGLFVALQPQTTSEQSLVKWLELRRGLRTCNVRKAFALYDHVDKAANDQPGCCIVSPGGVECHTTCPDGLSLPALCLQNI